MRLRRGASNAARRMGRMRGMAAQIECRPLSGRLYGSNQRGGAYCSRSGAPKACMFKCSQALLLPDADDRWTTLT